MKQLLPYFFFLFLSFQLSAQDNVTVEPNPFEDTFVVDLSNNSTEIIMHTVFINNFDETKTFKWQVALNSAGCPSQWQYKVCDANACYLWGVLTNEGGPVHEAVVLEPGDTSRLDLYVQPNGVAGCCNPSIFISEFEAPNTLLATAQYDVCIESATAVTEREKANLKVYPNPTADYISISNNNFVKKVWVSNILGKRVRMFNTTLGNNYDISMLPDGIYLVSMVDDNNKVLKTVRISKRAIRP